MGKKIRGLRRCTQRDCMLPLNRDKNGATNIGTNFMRLFEDKTPIPLHERRRSGLSSCLPLSRVRG